MVCSEQKLTSVVKFHTNLIGGLVKFRMSADIPDIYLQFLPSQFAGKSEYRWNLYQNIYQIWIYKLFPILAVNLWILESILHKSQGFMANTHVPVSNTYQVQLKLSIWWLTVDNCQYLSAHVNKKVNLSVIVNKCINVDNKSQ